MLAFHVPRYKFEKVLVYLRILRHGSAVNVCALIRKTVVAREDPKQATGTNSRGRLIGMDMSYRNNQYILEEEYDENYEPSESGKSGSLGTSVSIRVAMELAPW